ncbi:LytTR family DNA-binding domain-containing protein [Undibacterium sp. GrIS 1.2]|uniref:LytR/AlgR family response regulator transcription factor n=1 Tax=Undibacterium sp. GrIS 1.2 TaxID=3143933 RepID=UPI0033995EA1
MIRDRTQVHVIPVDKMEYVEAQDDYISIVSDAKSYLKTQSLSELEAQLDPKKFVRVHRSYLINIEQLKSIERSTKDSHVAIMHSGKQIPISRTGYERIRQIM